jgi:hypothetical protein
MVESHVVEHARGQLACSGHVELIGSFEGV